MVVTVVIRLLLLPLLLPSLKSMEKMNLLAPKLKALQEKYKDDKKKLAEAQMELYKQEGVNPLGGCLPQLLQIAVLIIFYSAFNQVVEFAVGKISVTQINAQLIPSFQVAENFKFDLGFMGSNLTSTPAQIFKDKLPMLLAAILLLGSGLMQFLSAKMMMPPAAKKVDDTAYTKQTPGAGDDMAAAMRTQSLYFMPAMTVFIGWNFSLGLLLYWFVNSGVMWGQQLVVKKIKKP